MMITSCFNRRYLSSTLIGIPLGILTLAGISSLKTSALIATVLVTAGFSLVGILGYLCWLRRITIVSDGIETQSVLLPFWRRYYRFAEFDYSETSSTRNGEVLRLIKDGRRVISISSSLYQNLISPSGRNFGTSTRSPSRKKRAAEAAFFLGKKSHY